MPQPDLEARLVALETKVAYQDRALADLSDVIYAQEQRLTKLESFARTAAPQLRSLGVEADPALGKPPHY
jgi:SlyX protein